ncbi:MAG: hypothetical protein PQJ61_10440 [Spirochaetales bacterium]|uniref:LPS-assembly protein LptD n=1 Tax=Candidatus Thalassospirochaeta sargassi TaxID=3119039 RepID=A0AAJ1ID85_9SPIO|nr:hypothetical protein [Spirochaetales bacterium]
MKKLVCAALIIILFSFSAAADEDSSLYSDTVLTDIETSSFHELTQWCRRLEISEEGSADEMRKRLYSYYNVNPSSNVDKSTSSGQQIEIETAENLEYFTIEKVDENYAKISGDVNLKLYDKDKNETHIIQADTILFNFKENYLTATGNIIYSLEGDTKTENFRGQKLTFNIDNTEGLFDSGITEQERVVDDEDIVFYFKGDLINKTKDNVVILENGDITSCDFDSPHYTIKARKIWLLTNNDWAILNGVIYIGRIPLFYFPAFLYGGDDIFFNPAFGFNSERGNYLQTTTYLVGTKEEDEDAVFSLMQSSEADLYYERSGLYLTENENPGEKEKAISDYGKNSDNYIKFILDYYSYLGIYSAIDLKLTSPTGSEKEAFSKFTNSLFTVFKNTELYLSAAKTRYYELDDGYYSVLFENDEGVYSSIWLDSFFLDLKIPLRYGLDFVTELDIDWLTADINLELYSDPEYTEDFFERSENFDLLSLLEQESFEESGSETSSTEWSASLNIGPDVKILNPFVKSFSLDVDTTLDWNSKEIDQDTGDYSDTVESFFYPDSYQPLSTSLNISGQVLPFTGSTESESEDDEDSEGLELKPPWEENAKYETTEKIENNLPDAATDISIDVSNFWSDTDIFSNSMSYSLTPQYTDKDQYGSSEWDNPYDIDFEDLDYSYRTASLSSKLTYEMNLYDSFLDVSNSLNLSFDYKEHYNMDSLSDDTISSYQNEDNQGTDAVISNNLTISSTPIVYLDYWEETKITYKFNSDLYNWDYSTDTGSFSNTLFTFTEDYVSSHEISLSIPFSGRKMKQTFDITTVLPPLDFETEGSYELEYGISTTAMSTEVYENDDEDGWDFEPLTLSEKLNFGDGNSFVNNISYDFTSLSFEKEIAELNLSFLNGDLSSSAYFTYDFTIPSVDSFDFSFAYLFFDTNFSAQYTDDYYFDTESGWDISAEDVFIPESWDFNLNYESETINLWKNRINLNIDLDSSLDFDLIQFTESSFLFEIGFDFQIYEFLELTFSSSSINKAIYRYFPSLCEQTGAKNLDVFEDLFKSFNFFNIDDRYASNFNLQSIDIKLKHDMHDWDLEISYTGSPYVNTDGTYPVYEWENGLDISITWKAIPDIKSEIEIDKDEISF